MGQYMGYSKKWIWYIYILQPTLARTIWGTIWGSYIQVMGDPFFLPKLWGTPAIRGMKTKHVPWISQCQINAGWWFGFFFHNIYLYISIIFPLVGGFIFFIFSHNIWDNPSHWRSPSCFRGLGWNHQPEWIYLQHFSDLFFSNILGKL